MEQKPKTTEAENNFQGGPWDEINLHRIKRVDIQAESRSKILLFLAILLMGFVIFGMATKDQQILKDSFELLRYGFVAFTSWAFGRWGSPPERER